MHRTPHPHGRSLGRPVALLVSVFALLAFACVPTVALAETVYKTEPTNLPENGGNTPTIPHNNPGGDESSPGAGASESPGDDGGSGQSNDDSSGSDNASGGVNPSSPGGGGDAQGRAGNGAPNGEKQPGLQDLDELNTATPTSAEDDSSSPLVPILIAVAVLAAISVGAVMARQRRGRDAGSPIAPKAG